jgi:hypothetical protein
MAFFLGKMIFVILQGVSGKMGSEAWFLDGLFCLHIGRNWKSTTIGAFRLYEGTFERQKAFILQELLSVPR